MTNLVTLAEVKDYLSINSTNMDAKLSNLITYASQLVETYCSREFTAANVTYEYKNGGLPYVFVDKPPINSVWSVAEYDGTQYVPLTNPPTAGLANTVANSNSSPGYSWDSKTGKIYKGFVIPTSPDSTVTPFPAYASGIQISYNGGYTTIPNDVKLCVLDTIKSLHKGLDAQETRFDREYIKQPTYTAGFPPHIKRVLDLYRLIE